MSLESSERPHSDFRNPNVGEQIISQEKLIFFEGLVIRWIMQNRPDINIIGILDSGDSKDEETFSNRLRTLIEKKPDLLDNWQEREIRGHGKKLAPTEESLQHIAESLLPAPLSKAA